jgi:hypothetical protein
MTNRQMYFDRNSIRLDIFLYYACETNIDSREKFRKQLEQGSFVASEGVLNRVEYVV